ncbi:MAG: glutaredoxin family protein, partial [Asgard group archaeon]|nr:glutaredoxin family protein [Asgard group archaeon]
MHENLEFTHEKGSNKPADITVYALSTCGFCRRALQFLRKNDIDFKYIYVDKQDSSVRIKIKRDLSETYKDHRLGFPFCVIDEGEDIIVGFTEEKWKKALLDRN